jgi:hypothetical protein
MTPLYWASYNGHTDIVNALKQALQQQLQEVRNKPGLFAFSNRIERDSCPKKETQGLNNTKYACRPDNFE